MNQFLMNLKVNKQTVSIFVLLLFANILIFCYLISIPLDISSNVSIPFLTIIDGVFKLFSIMSVSLQPWSIVILLFTFWLIVPLVFLSIVVFQVANSNVPILLFCLVYCILVTIFTLWVMDRGYYKSIWLEPILRKISLKTYFSLLCVLIFLNIIDRSSKYYDLPYHHIGIPTPMLSMLESSHPKLDDSKYYPIDLNDKSSEFLFHARVNNEMDLNTIINVYNRNGSKLSPINYKQIPYTHSIKKSPYWWKPDSEKSNIFWSSPNFLPKRCANHELHAFIAYNQVNRDMYLWHRKYSDAGRCGLWDLE
jgi:hypothetical protein